MKPACCISPRDLIAETDLRRRMIGEVFMVSIEGPRWSAQDKRVIYIYIIYTSRLPGFARVPSLPPALPQ